MHEQRSILQLLRQSAEQKLQRLAVEIGLNTLTCQGPLDTDHNSFCYTINRTEEKSMYVSVDERKAFDEIQRTFMIRNS